jgi:hypothetical protein
MHSVKCCTELFLVEAYRAQMLRLRAWPRRRDVFAPLLAGVAGITGLQKTGGQFVKGQAKRYLCTQGLHPTCRASAAA